jgi:hypothetical protein
MRPFLRSVLRGAAGLVILVAVAAYAMPAASAGTKPPPTANQLVTKLARAGVCSGSQAVDALGVAVDCKAVVSTIEVHALKSHATMLKDLDRGVKAWCATADRQLTGGSSGVHPNFRLGRTWWTGDYQPNENMAIQRVLGGTVKSFTCP